MFQLIKVIYLLLFITGGITISLSQTVNPDSLTLKGYVSDAEDRLPLSNVHAELDPGGKNSVTDSNGIFTIPSVRPGKYTVKLSLPGYQNISEEIEINYGSRNIFHFNLYSLGFTTDVITVTDDHMRSKYDDLLELSAVLKDKELLRDLGQTLALTLKDQTGISVRSMGPAPSRPVYRGLSGDRVMITEDGIKTIDLSSTSPDHSVTVEPFTVERIEVQRGPKILIKTPSAIGGVINVVRYEIPQYRPSKITLKLGAYGESSNSGYLGSGVLGLPFKDLVLRLESSYRKAADQNTPQGKLKNSDIKTYNLAGGLSLIKKWGYAGLSVREYNTDYGIPGGFVGAHPNGVDISMLKRTYSIKLHLKTGYKFLDHIDLDAARTYYRHTEYEAPGIIGAEFRILDYYSYLNFIHNKFGKFSQGTFGASFEYRDFNIGGFVFSPPSSSLNTAFYITEELNVSKKFSIELAGRYEYNYIKPKQQIQLANLDSVYSRKFNTLSAAVTSVYSVLKNLNAGLGLSFSSRVPTIEELFSDGPHLAAYSYEIGNPGLKEETAYGSELFIYYKNSSVYMMLTSFYNRINDYIIARNTGRINVATLLPVYQTTGVNAVLAGFESQFDLKFFDKFELNSSLSYTYGQIINSNSPLPQIPPVKGVTSVSFKSGYFIFGINSEYAASQKRLDDFEQYTPGYIIFGSFAQYLLQNGDIQHSLSLNADNITNRIYRNHLSRIKSILPEPGFNIRLTYKFIF